MEKYSAFRDPGTGIQPYLTPVPPQGSETVEMLLRPILYITGFLRTILITVLGLIYVLLSLLSYVILPIPVLQRAYKYFLTAVIARSVLLLAGIHRISVEITGRRKSRNLKDVSWNPKGGDIIVSNWVSWLELVWLLKFNPIFVIPLVEEADSTSADNSSQNISHGIGSGRRAALNSSPVPHARRSVIGGFREVSVIQLITHCGFTPPFQGIAGVHEKSLSLHELLDRAKQSGQAIVLFPECTTSNGRGLLRFSNIKGLELPVKDVNLFLMCVRIDPPTLMAPSLSLSMPASSPFMNIIRHIFSITCSLSSQTLSIRLLSPLESPSAISLSNDTTFNNQTTGNTLMNICADLISDIGRLKRTGMGWEEKSLFLKFHAGKTSH